MKKNKKGFILYYSVVVMLLIVSMITFMLTLVIANTKGNAELLKNVDERVLLDQYAEYFIHDKTYVFEESEDFEFVVNDNVLKIKSKETNNVKLYLELDASGNVVRKKYADYKSGE